MTWVILTDVQRLVLQMYPNSYMHYTSGRDTREEIQFCRIELADIYVYFAAFT